MAQHEVSMPPKYDHRAVEAGRYDWWLKGKFFETTGDPDKQPFTIVIPPPNVTGKLHLGHAWDTTLQDIITRMKRMQGYDVLWLPGMDHAGIATQAKVEEKLRQQGLSRYDLGREKFLEETWKWKEEYAGHIRSQWAKLGLGLDYTRERFTLDEGLSKAVREVFVSLYRKGLIYRGEYIINWDPATKTALSDIEVIYKEVKGALYHLRYPLADGSGYIEVATTRPETMLGDTAVAVHPDDERYKHLIGKMVKLPIVGREIPIIADEYVDMEFGSGAVKITPAHDPNDFEVGNRHNLPRILVMNEDGTMNENALQYQGLDRFECRKQIVRDLQEQGVLFKIEEHVHSVGHSERSGAVVEPYLSTQWFVKMKPLAEAAIKMQQTEGKVQFVPERFEKTYLHWLENIRDWCISRQLWWGHRIPVWYTPDGQMIVPGPDDPEPTGEGVTQDPDVLDTWFSSGLWPFSTLGWPDDTPDLRYFYPTSVMETGYDILFFWVARMMMMGCYLTGKEPFHTVYLHGLVRDKDGRKMSKSYGNVVNPLEVMEQYGTDALRFTLATSGTPGQDLNLNPERIESARNFANKIWNITRFVLSKLGPARGQEAGAKGLLPGASLADRWIMSRYSRLVGDVDRLMRAYNFGEAGRQIQEFLWGEFADWYVEVAKVQLEGDEAAQRATRAVLFEVLEGCLRLLHPFMPFVTEEAWQYLTGAQRSAQGDGASGQPASRSIMVMPYPQADEQLVDEAAERDFELVQDIITGIRNIRNEYKVEPARFVAAIVAAGERKGLIEAQRPLIVRLARVAADQLTVAERLEARPQQAATLVVRDVEVFLPLAGMIDLEAERARLRKELAAAEADIARREGRLANAGFVQKAPEHVVQRERDGLAAVRATAGSMSRPARSTATPRPFRSASARRSSRSRAASTSSGAGVNTSLIVGIWRGEMAVRARKPCRSRISVVSLSGPVSRTAVSVGPTGASSPAAADASTIRDRIGHSSSRAGPGRMASSPARSASPRPSRTTRGASATSSARSTPTADSMSARIANVPAGRPCACSLAPSAASARASRAGSALGTITPRRPGTATAPTSSSSVSAFTRTHSCGPRPASAETRNVRACSRAAAFAAAATASSRSRMSASAPLRGALASLSGWSAGTYR